MLIMVKLSVNIISRMIFQPVWAIAYSTYNMAHTIIEKLTTGLRMNDINTDFMKLFTIWMIFTQTKK